MESDWERSAPDPHAGEVEEIPLFPLNMVLFPGMMQPLHIFEERYKAMVRFCLETTSPFGVVWDRPDVGDAVEGVAAVGTAAAIVHIEPLEEGRMNILAVGRSRFQILAMYRDRPYLMARVRRFPFRMGHELRAVALSHRVRDYMGAYTALLEEVAGIELRMGDWPEQLAAAAVLAAIALQVPLSDKQRLLAAPTVDQMLAAEVRLFRREKVLLSHMRDMLRSPERMERTAFGPFSLN